MIRKFLLQTIIGIAFLLSSQIAFASGNYSNKVKAAIKHTHSSEESTPQETQAAKQGCEECEDSDFANYGKDDIIKLPHSSKSLAMFNQKSPHDFTRSPSSPPPDISIS